MVDVSRLRGTMSQKAKVVPKAQSCIPRFNPAVERKADRLPCRPIARIRTCINVRKDPQLTWT